MGSQKPYVLYVISFDSNIGVYMCVPGGGVLVNVMGEGK